MSNEQANNLKLWSGAFMKVLLGVSGTCLVLLYYSAKDDAEMYRNEFRHSIDKIENTTNEINKSVNQMESRMKVMEYQLKQQDDHGN